MTGNPIKYTSETYNTILADINATPALVDKPEWWKRIWAGVGDMLSMLRNAMANNAFLRTAFTRPATTDLLELIDYRITPQSTSTGTLMFYFDPDAVSYPKTVTVPNLRALYPGDIAQAAKTFECREQVTVLAFTQLFTANASTDIITVPQNVPHLSLIRVSSAGTLPGGLTAGTNYYVYRVSATEIKLATSVANAVAGTTIDITSTGSGAHTMALHSFETTAWQQETVSSVLLGTSDGVTPWLELDFPDQLVLDATIAILVNSQPFTLVTTFVRSLATDKVFRMFTKTDSTVFARFGDGVFGAIPGAFDVFASYAKGGGPDSNVKGLNKINSYTGSDADIIGVTNTTDFTGGGAEETLENAKKVGPVLLKARDTFISVEDGEALTLASGGVSVVGIVKNQFGVLSAGVYVVPNGGGLPSSQLKSELQTYLRQRTVLEEPYILVGDPDYNPQDTTVAFKPRPGFTFAQVTPYVRLAIKLFFAETGKEIKSLFDAQGVSEATTAINTYFSESFNDTDAPQIIELLTNLVPAEFGVTIQLSDFVAYIDANVLGLDYLTTTLPVFPIIQDGDQITQYGTITITQIS